MGVVLKHSKLCGCTVLYSTEATFGGGIQVAAKQQNPEIHD